MIGGVTRHMLPHLPGVPHLHVNRPLIGTITMNKHIRFQDDSTCHKKFVWKIAFTSPKDEISLFSSYFPRKQDTKGDNWSTYASNTKPVVQCPLYRGVRIIEVGNVWFVAFLGPNELSVIERCPYYRGVRKERLDCIREVQGTKRHQNYLPTHGNCFTHLHTMPAFAILILCCS